jgi:membrane-associated phospholipid phosphatase
MVAGVLLLAVTVEAAALGLTMVAICTHYPTDTVAGFCTAVAVTLGMGTAAERARQRARHPTRRPAGGSAHSRASAAHEPR